MCQKQTAENVYGHIGRRSTQLSPLVSTVVAGLMMCGMSGAAPVGVASSRPTGVVLACSCSSSTQPFVPKRCVIGRARWGNVVLIKMGARRWCRRVAFGRRWLACRCRQNLAGSTSWRRRTSKLQKLPKLRRFVKKLFVVPVPWLMTA